MYPVLLWKSSSLLLGLMSNDFEVLKANMIEKNEKKNTLFCLI